MMHIKQSTLIIGLTLIGLFSVSESVYAQDEVKSIVKKISVQAGVNLSYPLINSLRKQPIDSFNLASPNVYAELGYKRWYIRLGAGGRSTFQKNRSDLADNVSQEDRIKMTFTASILYRTDVSNKMSIYAGAYVWNQYFLDETTYDSGFDLSTKYTEMNGYAAGPGIKFEYRLTNKLSLFTEYCALYRVDYRYSGRTFSAFPNEGYKVHASTLNSIVFEHPISLFLTYKF